VDLSELQSDHFLWVSKNFPDQKPWEPLLGLAEEVGELSHAHLKFHQGIRGYDYDKWVLEAGDAVGDIIIYLASYCNANNLELDYCAHNTWHRVKNRNWVADPQTGGEK
jgi:NTP pyrophosphatase (non-canonical NTP hydrolase)